MTIDFHLLKVNIFFQKDEDTEEQKRGETEAFGGKKAEDGERENPASAEPAVGGAGAEKRDEQGGAGGAVDRAVEHARLRIEAGGEEGEEGEFVVADGELFFDFGPAAGLGGGEGEGEEGGVTIGWD